MKARKKFKAGISVLLAALMISSLAACGNKDGADHSSDQREGQDSVSSSDAGVSGHTQSDSNILIAYFSRWGNTDYPDDIDASASASVVIDKERFGTTEYMAQMIQKTIGGDLHFIETKTPYTADFDELREINHKEMDKDYLPELKESNLNISQYDMIFIGYPVWATDVPQAVISFLKQYDLSGKTVIPFCTHDGYGAGSSYSTISRESKSAKTLDGLAVESKDVIGAEDNIAEWLESIGIFRQESDNTQNNESSAVQEGETAIKIIIGDIVLDGVIYDTALAQEIKEQFPLTISMAGYGGREYYGGVDFYPENVEGGKKTFENGDITYCEAHHNMAVFYAQTDNPTLSVEVIPIGRVMSDLAVFDTLGSREDITFSIAE